MRGARVLAGLLGMAAAAAASEEPALLPPWIVAESRLRPDAESARASAWFADETWSGRALVTLADAFRHIPGAVMQESFGGFEPPRLSIRGSGVQSAPTSRGLQLRFDALPLGLADGTFNAALFDPSLASAVAVQRGLDGWRSSPVTMGGAIELRSSMSGEDVTPVARLEAGSFGARRGRLIFGGASGAVSARAAVSHAQQDGFREHSAQGRTAASGTLAYEMSSATRVTVGVYHANARYDVPGPLTLAAARGAPRSISADVRRDQPRRVADVTRLGAAVRRRAHDWELELAAGAARMRDDFRQLQANGITESRSDDASARATAARRFSIVGLAQQLRLTADMSRGWRDVRRLHNDDGHRGSEFGRDRLNPTTGFVAVEDALALGRDVVVTAGIAHAFSRRNLAGKRDGAALRWRDSRLLPQASVRWRTAPDITLFAGISSVTEAPAFDDLVALTGSGGSLGRRLNPLNAQRATTVEAGLRGQLRALAWDLTVYEADWRDEILRLADAQGAARGAVNASRTRHRGVEAAGRWRLLDGGVRVTLAASATWNDYRFRDDTQYGRSRLAGLPPNIGYADLVLELPRELFVAGGVDWTHGRTRVDHAGRLDFGGRALSHLRAGWRTHQWTWFVEVRNLFDRVTIASTAGVLDLARNPAATAIFLPAPGRSVNVGLEWRR